jgi:hypothetical protein
MNDVENILGLILGTKTIPGVKLTEIKTPHPASVPGKISDGNFVAKA